MATCFDDPTARATFLETLRETGSVKAAAASIGIARHWANEVRRRDPQLAADWAVALDEAMEDLEAEARRRALGEMVPIYADEGAEDPLAIIGYRRAAYSDALLMFMLRAHRPEKYRETTKVDLNAKIESAGKTADQLRTELVSELIGLGVLRAEPGSDSEAQSPTTH